MKIKLIQALEKCFLDDNIDLKEEYNRGSCLKEERFRFGLCYIDEELCESAKPVLLTVKSEIAEHITVKRVEHVPVKLPAYRTAKNEDYLRTTPELFPNLLTPLNSHKRLLLNNNLESLFIEVDTKGIYKAGVYPIEFVLSDFNSKGVLVINNKAYERNIYDLP